MRHAYVSGLVVLLCRLHAGFAWAPFKPQSSFAGTFRKHMRRAGLQANTVAQAAGMTASMPDPLKDISQSMCDAVKQAQLLSHPPLFTIANDSALARKVQSLRIPLHPKSTPDTIMPYMLMHGLTEPNMTSFVSFVDKATVRLQATKKKTVLLGCFGAGKTRVAMEMLAEEFGIYLPVNDEEGWQDLSSFFSAIDKETSKQASAANMQILKELVESLVLSRLVVLDAMLKEYSDLTPAQWIWAQKHPRSIFRNPAALMVTLKAVWKLCREAGWTSSADRVHAIKALQRGLQQHMKTKEGLLCIVDEPQLLFTLFDGRFPVEGEPSPTTQALYAPMMSCLSSLSDLVICGSSSSLLSQLMPPNAATAATGAQPGMVQDFNVVAQSTPTSPQECRDFVDIFLDTSELSSTQLDEIAEMLSGRPYFIERFVSAALTRAANVLSSMSGHPLEDKHRKAHEVFQQLLSEQTTPLTQAVSTPLYLLNTMHGTIARAAGTSPYKSTISQPLLMQFRAAALKLWDTGEVQTLPYHEAAGLVDEGLANVAATERGPEVVIQELVVALAAKNFWESPMQENAASPRALQ